MKTDRFSVTLAAAVLLAGLLLAAGRPAAGGTFSVSIGGARITFESPSKKLAKALAQQVGEVKKRFDENRHALRTVQGPDGKPALLRKDVADLISRTGDDLDQAIEKVQPSDLSPLRAWSDDELARIRTELGAGSKTAAFPSGFFAPQAVAVIASLGSPPKKPASPKAVAPKPVAPPPDTVPAQKSNSILDELGAVVSQIFTLAENDDLQVKIWIGSTAPRTDFSFWPQNQAQGDDKATHTLRTDGKLDHIFRGLYAYKAAWTQGAVKNSISYPPPADAPNGETSEPLDLVKGSRFFCCRFDRTYCHHVDNEKECRP